MGLVQLPEGRSWAGAQSSRGSVLGSAPPGLRAQPCQHNLLLPSSGKITLRGLKRRLRSQGPGQEGQGGKGEMDGGRLCSSSRFFPRCYSPEDALHCGVLSVTRLCLAFPNIQRPKTLCQQQNPALEVQIPPKGGCWGLIPGAAWAHCSGLVSSLQLLLSPSPTPGCAGRALGSPSDQGQVWALCTSGIWHQ